MLVVLPPSETKRDGGDAERALDLDALAFPQLNRQRRAVLAGLRKVSTSVAASTAALKLGATQRDEIARNRAVRSSPVMPAIERYTGVLYDALDAAHLDPDARAWLDAHVVVHSALFGPVRAGDPVPAYRLSHDSRLPELPLKRTWREPVASALATHEGLVLDLRSESYVELGPAPAGSVYLRVVSEGEGGVRRALNHFNKHGKGAFVRRLAETRARVDDVDGLLAWAAAAGVRLERTDDPGELQLVV
jgi:uncharacterized protein